ncbi:MAG: Lrp/AsnC family transcriptional regulator [Candidatus Thermoplasmatota archaeon]|nr:Lrp/AsnC family transcriptional regulator [Candidatus Thermoplasmatota archaeon]
MEKLDLKDTKILYNLTINSRQSYSQLGKLVGLSKNIVKYRIDRLMDKEIIKNFFTVIDTFKLGCICARFHYVFQYVTPKTEKEIIDFFVKNKYTTLVVATQGAFDLSVIACVQEMKDFYQFYQETQNRYANYFQSQQLSHYVNDMHFKPTYLIVENYKKSDRVESIRTANVQKADIDNTDMKILRLLAKNARFSINEIAKELDTTSWKINQRYKNLIKNGLIRGFTANIDISKIGFQACKIYIHLSIPKFKTGIINYIKFNPFLVCIDETTGDSDLELEFYLKDISSVHDIMQDISKHFPDIIRSYDFATAVKFYKHLYLPY